MSESTKKKSRIYLPTILLGVIVAAIFLMAIFTYQVGATERALVLTMGKISAETGPGLHFKLPLPFQEVVKYDVRKRCFEGKIGKIEEVATRDQKQVVVGINVFYYIKDLVRFKTASSLAAAEEFLSSTMQTVKGSVVGQYNYRELINTDPKQMKLEEMKREMLARIQPIMMERYGLEVFDVTFSTINVPEKTAEEIAKRMTSERTKIAQEYMAKGIKEAARISSEAKIQSSKIITEAEALAKKDMAEGDAEAAKYLQVFSEAPELAEFLRKLESMRRILGSKTTLIFDTSLPPFDVFNGDFLHKESSPAPKK